MTLDTRIYIVGEIDAHEVYTKANALLLDYLRLEGRMVPGRVKTFDKRRNRWDRATNSWVPGDRWTIGNQMDQGLPALLDISYKPDGPLRTQAEADVCDEDCDPDCDKAWHYPACWLEVSFDTAYGYRTSIGGCGDLHMRLVNDLGRWLEEQGVTEWGWCNEFTGERFFDPVERYVRLTELVNGGQEATEWFNSVVKPAIEAEIRKS